MGDFRVEFTVNVRKISVANINIIPGNWGQTPVFIKSKKMIPWKKRTKMPKKYISEK